MSAYVYFDNMNQAVEQGGRVVNDLLPYIIGDDERTMILSKKDGKTDTVRINERASDGSIKNDLGVGDFDVEIDTGPSFAVQKEIALEFLQTTLQAQPTAFPLIADLWAKNLDVQFMPQMAERFKTLVPPQILAKEEGKQLPPQPPSPQEQLMMMEIQAKKADIQSQLAENQNKQEKMQLEKQQHLLDQMELMVNARKIQQDAQLNVFDHRLNLAKAEVTHRLDSKKADQDFMHKMAALMAELYKHENPQETKQGD